MLRPQETIRYISASRLYPHKDNPRKELGDLTELADSIKTNGVLQNLTVVPWELANPAASDLEKADHIEDYTILIGHRRSAAAEIAEATELPCIVNTSLTYREQVSIMLTENMQRTDLTLYEQTQCIQLMLELGDSVAGVAKKTGLSESTVRRRAKLSELDQDKLKEASVRQISMEDLDKLAKIEDITVRNKLLDDIGTSNYAYRYSDELKKQEQQKDKLLRRAEMQQLIDEGYDIDEANKTPSGKDYIYGCSLSSSLLEIKSKFYKTRKNYLYYSYGTIYIYADPDKKRGKTKVSKEEQARREAIDALEAASKTAYKLRREFVANYPVPDAKKHIKEICEMVAYKKFGGFNCYGNDVSFAIEYSGISKNEAQENPTLVAKNITAQPEKGLLVLAYSYLNDDADTGYHNGYYGTYRKNSFLDALYDVLCRLGYQMSDEEKALQDGTSPLFVTEGKK